MFFKFEINLRNKINKWNRIDSFKTVCELRLLEHRVWKIIRNWWNREKTIRHYFFHFDSCTTRSKLLLLNLYIYSQLYQDQSNWNRPMIIQQLSIVWWVYEWYETIKIISIFENSFRLKAIRIFWYEINYWVKLFVSEA